MQPRRRAKFIRIKCRGQQRVAPAHAVADRAFRSARYRLRTQKIEYRAGVLDHHLVDERAPLHDHALRSSDGRSLNDTMRPPASASEAHVALAVIEIRHRDMIAGGRDAPRDVEQLLAQAPDIHVDDDRRKRPHLPAIRGFVIGAPSTVGLARSARAVPAFNAQAFLDSAGIAKTIVEYGRGERPSSRRATPASDVLYIQTGGVKLSVLSKTGREAVVAMLGPGDFFGEGCLAGQPVRMGSATAITPSVILLVAKEKMVRLLHKQHAMSDRFIAHMLSRNIRIEEDLIDQLFNSSEKRLARTLLLLARYGKQDKPARMVPKISQETLAEMVGTTRSRVNFFLNKFKKLGFIEYNGEIPLKINSSLLSVVLHD